MTWNKIFCKDYIIMYDNSELLGEIYEKYCLKLLLKEFKTF